MFCNLNPFHSVKYASMKYKANQGWADQLEVLTGEDESQLQSVLVFCRHALVLHPCPSTWLEGCHFRWRYCQWCKIVWFWWYHKACVPCPSHVWMTVCAPDTEPASTLSWSWVCKYPGLVVYGFVGMCWRKHIKRCQRSSQSYRNCSSRLNSAHSTQCPHKCYLCFSFIIYLLLSQSLSTPSSRLPNQY